MFCVGFFSNLLYICFDAVGLAAVATGVAISVERGAEICKSAPCSRQITTPAPR